MGDSNSIDLKACTLEDFSSHVGSQFTCNEMDACQFELTEASEFKTEQVCEGGRKPFSLVFKTANTIEPQQGIHQLSHDTLGDISLFLVPVEESEGHYHYEATFN